MQKNHRCYSYVYKKYDKERKPKFIGEYNREFIDDYNVEVIDYLMNNTITPNAMSASLMNLIYKKNVIVHGVNSNLLFYKVWNKKYDEIKIGRVF